jgi:hypothetical protein
MTQENFTQYLLNTDALDANSLLEIKELVNTYPYFQTAYILYLLNLQKLNHTDYNKQLSFASAHLSNRKLLKQKTEELLKKEKTTGKTSLELKKEESEIIKEINVIAESTVSDVSSTLQDNNTTQSEKIIDINTPQSTEIQEISITNQQVDYLIEEDKKIDEKIDNETNNLNQNKDLSINLLASEVADNLDATSDITTTESDIQPNKEEIIDKFIKGKPKINALQSNKDYSLDIDKNSLAENDDFVSETLALVYEKQGYYTKAIKIYQKLILEFPEKSSFFASRIEKLKNTSNQ